MLRIADVAAAAAIVETISRVYDAHAERKRKAREEAKDRRIHDLEERLARLEAVAPSRIIVP